MHQENPFIGEIREVIDKYSDRKAVIYYETDKIIQDLTYKELNENSEIIKEGLKEFKGCCVGLFMDYNPFIPSIILGLQSLNCPFSFLKAPQVTLKYLQIIITLNKELENPDYLLKNHIDLPWGNKLNIYESKSEQKLNLNLKNINYIIQTSGTTGSSKDVWVEHYCIYSNIQSLKSKLNITEKEVIYLQTNLTFDPSMIELYLSLTTGSCLLITSNQLKEDLSKLYSVLFKNPIKDYNITFLQMCPSIFLRWTQKEIYYILNESNLKILLLGGEDFPKQLSTYFINTKTRVFNVYGITEISCWASIKEIDFKSDISLGEPLSDTLFEIRDENNKVVDEEGELFIGSFKRICYLNNEVNKKLNIPLFRRTGDLVYVKNNQIFYKGRIGDVFKRFGIRINLNEIEKEIFQITNLENKLVYLEDKSKLILFVKLSEKKESIILRICDKLRIKLLHSLKQEYFPDYIEGLLSFPLTKHGKIDQNKLKNLANQLINKTLHKNTSFYSEVDIFKTLWIKYLPQNLSDFYNKTFYECGGSSILRLQFTNEFKELISVKNQLPTQFFDYLFTNPYDKIINFIESYKFEHKTFIHPNKRLKTLNDESKLKIKWSYDLKGCVDATPFIIQNKKLITIGSFSNILATLNLTIGEEIFKVTLPNSIENSCTSTSSGEMIIIGCYDGYLYCIDINTQNIIWSYRTKDKIKNKPTFISNNSRIVFGSYDKNVYCLGTKKGNLKWKILIDSGITADPLYLKEINSIFIASINGSCLLINTNGEILWKIKLKSPIFSSPCLFQCDKIIVAEVQGIVYCLNYKNLEIIWNYNINNHIYSSLTTTTNLILFTSHDSCLYCLEEIDEKIIQIKFKIQLDSPSSSSVAVVKNNTQIYLITASINGTIYVTDYYQQIILDKIKLEGEIFSSPVIYCNDETSLMIFIGCRDDKLYCIEYVGINKNV